MTCILAYVDKESVVHIAGDSAGTDVKRHTRVDLSSKKIFRHGNMLMGYTTSFRMGQILENCLEPPERKEGLTDYQYLVKQFVPALKKLYTDEGYMLATEKEGGTFIIGWNGALYEIEDDFAVLPQSNCFTSCGSGTSQAKAAFMALLEHGVVDKIGAEAALRSVLDITSRFNITVSGRIDYLNDAEPNFQSLSQATK